MPRIRPEEPADHAAIHDVLMAAFPTDEEARLVAQLRESGHLKISLVAEDDNQVVGYIGFSPVSAGEDDQGLGLAPIAVVPDRQNEGIGGELVEAGIAACRDYDAHYVVVLGHSHYYPRFGFQMASALGYGNEYGASESFMILPLKPDRMPPPLYHSIWLRVQRLDLGVAWCCTSHPTRVVRFLHPC